MTIKVLIVEGTSSSAGKSLLVTALYRIYARLGIKVAPFKAQNMSNNAAVCTDGSEIRRAQALQTAAAGIIPIVDINPVLIKPEADSRSRIIFMGRPWHTLEAKNYYEKKSILWEQGRGADGSVSSDGKIWGCYLHGFFGNDEFRHTWLESMGWERRTSLQSDVFNKALETLVDAV